MKEIRPHLWISCLLVLVATHAFGRCRDTVVPGASINQISIGMNQKDLEKIREGGPQESDTGGAKVITIGSTQVTLVDGVVQSLSTDFPQASRFCILVSGKRLTSKSSLNELKKLYAPCELKTSASGQQLACLSGAINFVFGGKNGELSTVSVSREARPGSSEPRL
jgi:hypothetical protein